MKYIPGNADKDVPMSSPYQTDYSKLSDEEKFMWDAAEEFLRAGMDQSEIYNLMDNDEFEADAKAYMEEGENGMEYARMLLNKWSGVPRHEMRDDEVMESKLVKEKLNEGRGTNTELLRQLVKMSNNSRLTQEAALMLSESLSDDEMRRFLEWCYHANRN